MMLILKYSINLWLGRNMDWRNSKVSFLSLSAHKLDAEENLVY